MDINTIKEIVTSELNMRINLGKSKSQNSELTLILKFLNAYEERIKKEQEIKDKY